ncbi:hypothetical protein FACS1894159_03590 [Bacteroidia bacterium]|nr:hypothetical protein FACS1894159_03590 [Bacteroidia bacterium]
MFSCRDDSAGGPKATTMPLSGGVYNAVTDLFEITIEGSIAGNISEVSEKGFIFSQNNKFDVVKIPVGLTGDFSLRLDTLTKGGVNYVRAYVLTPRGRSLGETLSFTASTLALLGDATDLDSDVTGTTILASGQITSNGGSAVKEYGLYFGVDPDPLRNERIVVTRIDGAGIFSAQMRSLTPQTDYVVAFFVVNSMGEQLVGPITIRTMALATPAVEFDTPATDGITAALMTVHARITDFGHDPDAAYGVRYGTSLSAMTELPGTDVAAGGAFSVSLSGLEADTNYYIEAFVRNAAGEGKAQTTAHTLTIGPPTVTTATLVAGTDFLDKTITLRGVMISDDGRAVASCGFYFGTSAGAMAKLTASALPAVDGTFSMTLTDLTHSIAPATKYYCRAWADNGQESTNTDTGSLTTGIADKQIYLRGAGTSSTMPFTGTRLYYYLLEPFNVTIGAQSVDLVFLDRNLGATKVAESVDYDKMAAGYYYRWGLLDPNVSPLAEFTGGTTPACWSWLGDVSLSGTTYADWGAWAASGTSTASGVPCPNGFHVARQTEMNALIANGNISSQTFYNTLKLCVTSDFGGAGAFQNPTLTTTPTIFLWLDEKNTGNASHASYLSATASTALTGNTNNNPAQTTRAKPVRCVRDY